MIAQKESFLGLYKGLGAVISGMPSLILNRMDPDSNLKQSQVWSVWLDWNVILGIVPKMSIRFASFETYKGWLADQNTGKVSSTSIFFCMNLFFAFHKLIMRPTSNWKFTSSTMSSRIGGRYYRGCGHRVPDGGGQNPITGSDALNVRPLGHSQMWVFPINWRSSSVTDQDSKLGYILRSKRGACSLSDPERRRSTNSIPRCGSDCPSTGYQPSCQLHSLHRTQSSLPTSSTKVSRGRATVLSNLGARLDFGCSRPLHQRTHRHHQDSDPKVDRHSRWDGLDEVESGIGWDVCAGRTQGFLQGYHPKSHESGPWAGRSVYGMWLTICSGCGHGCAHIIKSNHHLIISFNRSTKKLRPS